MGSFLERGDVLYWEKQVSGLIKLFDKIEILLKESNLHEDQIRPIKKSIKHYKKIFVEE